MKSLFCTLILSLAACTLSAQIYSLGDDPGKLKWKTVRTDEYKLIYPAGLDSLAQVYAQALESHRRDVGRSIGVEPNGMYRTPLPVILHPYMAASNGMVTWAPRRMELYTGPDALSPEALDWVTNLTIHESRHAAQMQMGRDRAAYKVINFLTGEALPGIMAGVYPGQALLEGDAVVAETALTAMGRGRDAAFLEYLMASFDEGSMRDWYAWRYRSLKYYTPDHYKLGYLTVAGTRYLYDVPDFTARYFSNISSGRLPFRFSVLDKTLKEISGMNLRHTWEAIAAAQDSIWKDNIASRGPFTEAEQVTPSASRFTQYTGTVLMGGSLYSISDGIASGTRLVRMDSEGRRLFSRPFSKSTSRLSASESDGRLYWSEITPDPRWSLKQSSRIRYMEQGSRRFKTLTREGRLSNPAVSPDGHAISVTDYPYTGGSSIDVISVADGHVLSRYPAPDSLQVVESCWRDGRLYAYAISPAGTGIYDVSGGYKAVLAPQPVRISQLKSGADGLLFVSDRLGVNELYCLKDSGALIRMTNNRLGASDFAVSGDSLYFSALTADGRAVYKEKISPVGETDYSTRYRYPIADRLSEQEAELKKSDTRAAQQIHISEERDFRKLTHLFRFHTWMPFYVDQDVISSMSFETLTEDLKLGAMAMTQNSLGTASGSIGWSYDPRDGSTERSGLHGRFTYSGRYPVVELKLNVTDRPVNSYHISTLVLSPARSSSSMENRKTDISPHLDGSVRVYVPMNFSSGGWNRGLVPQAGISFSNDRMSTSIVYRDYVPVTGEERGIMTFFDGAANGHLYPLARLNASLRGYVMTSTPTACSYPRWGIGAEAGVSTRPGLSDIMSDNLYAHIYGYVPGLLPSHGVRLHVLSQHQSGALFKEMYTNILPVGFTAISDINRYTMARYPLQTRLGVEYAMPLLNLDWSGLGSLAFVRNIDLRPHFEYTILGGSDIYKTGGLYSIGTELCVNLGNLAMVPYPARIGVSYSFNGGRSWDSMADSQLRGLERNNITLVFSISM